MLKNRLAIVVVSLLCLCSCATERSMQGVEGVGSEPGRYDVTWDSPSKNAAGSIPLGNGDIGLNAWVEENGDLAFYISKTDSWGDNGRLLKVGKLRVSLTPSPIAAPHVPRYPNQSGR